MSSSKTITVKVEPDLSALRELLVAVDTIKALRAQHCDNGHGWCQGCGVDVSHPGAWAVRWPCPTTRWLDLSAVGPTREDTK